MALPDRVEIWLLASLQRHLVKTGGRLVKHTRYHWLLLAESHLTRRFFEAIVRRITNFVAAGGLEFGGGREETQRLLQAGQGGVGANTGERELQHIPDLEESRLAAIGDWWY